jgi:hypothetical protein
MSVIIERHVQSFAPEIIKYGLGYGAAAAMILSYSANQSILWMLIHGWFSWLYVLYFALFKS